MSMAQKQNSREDQREQWRGDRSQNRVGHALTLLCKGTHLQQLRHRLVRAGVAEQSIENFYCLIDSKCQSQNLAWNKPPHSSPGPKAQGLSTLAMDLKIKCLQGLCRQMNLRYTLEDVLPATEYNVCCNTPASTPHLDCPAGPTQAIAEAINAQTLTKYGRMVFTAEDILQPIINFPLQFASASLPVPTATAADDSAAMETAIAVCGKVSASDLPWLPL